MQQIARKIGDRALLWFGTRSTDAASLREFDAFSGAFTITAPLGLTTRPGFVESCLEELSGARVDLNRYSIDNDESEEARSLQGELVCQLRDGALLATYRPCEFLAAACYPRLGHARYLGLFIGHQAAFEHKPWVETELRAAGVRTIPWDYYRTGDIDVLLDRVAEGPYVLRANYSDGGVGLTLLRPDERPHDHLPENAANASFVAAAPFLEPNIPLNVSGCVFADGQVTVLGPSLQLIGIPTLTRGVFGYCGNDFAAVADAIDAGALDELEQTVVTTGRWLASHGYIGAFGVDALYHEGRIWLTEVNPRFQGCSGASAIVAQRLGMSDVFHDHLAAFLGLQADSTRPRLRDIARLQAEHSAQTSQAICYNVDQDSMLLPGAIEPDLRGSSVKAVPEHGLTVRADAMLFKLIIDSVATRDGFSLQPQVTESVLSTRRVLYGF